MIFNYKIFLILYLSILFTNSSLAIPDSGNLSINSDKLIIENDASKATFIGSVTVMFDKFTLTTSKLTVFYDNVNNNREIKTIVIPVKLKIIKNCSEEIVISDEGHFDNITKELTLKGNVIMQKEGNILATNKLIYSTSLLRE